MKKKSILFIHHSPSENTKKLSTLVENKIDTITTDVNLKTLNMFVRRMMNEIIAPVQNRLADAQLNFVSGRKNILGGNTWRDHWTGSE